MNYEIIIYRSEPECAYIVEMPEFPGCCADGATKFKAFLAVEKIARELVQTAKELGRPIPEPRVRLLSPEAYEESAGEAQITCDMTMMKRALQEHAEGKSRPARDYFDELHAKLLAMKAAQSNGSTK